MAGAEWVVVVEPTSPEAAERMFGSWLSDHPGLRARLEGEDVRIDLIRGEGGVCLRRYLVRREVIEAGEA